MFGLIYIFCTSVFCISHLPVSVQMAFLPECIMSTPKKKIHNLFPCLNCKWSHPKKIKNKRHDWNYANCSKGRGLFSTLERLIPHPTYTQTATPPPLSLAFIFYLPHSSHDCDCDVVFLYRLWFSIYVTYGCDCDLMSIYRLWFGTYVYIFIRIKSNQIKCIYIHEFLMMKVLYLDTTCGDCNLVHTYIRIYVCTYARIWRS